MLMRRRILLWGAIVLGTYLAFCLLAYALQTRLVYFPAREVDDTPAQNGMPFEDVTLVTADGVRLGAWFVPADNAQFTVLISHGNGGNICNCIDTLRIFHKLGANVFIYDYRGYGRSEGSPSEEGTYRDAETAWKWLVETRGVKPSEIILFGRSLGGALASHLAEMNDGSSRPAGLILESTFTTLPDMAAVAYSWLPGRALCKYKYDTLSRMGRIHCPVLVVHSTEDEMVPYDMGRKLYAAAGEPKQFLRILGSHNGGFRRSQAEYEKGLREFLAGLNPGNRP